MKGLLPIVGLLCGLGLVGCQSMGTASKQKVYAYNLQQQCPSTLEMKVGETLQLQVYENVTTGYRWSVLQPLKHLKMEESYIKQKHQPMLVGGGDDKVYRFTAMQQGEDVIQMIHERGWVKSEAAVQWECRVRVL